MINLIISLTIAAAVYALFSYVIGAGYAWSIIFAFAALMALNYFLSKRVMNRVTEIMESAGKVLQMGKFDIGIKSLEGALKYSKWMFMIKGQILAQIGMVHFLKKDFGTALPYLQKTSKKNWAAMGMQAVAYMKKKDYDNMNKVFKKAVKSNSKESIMWNLYAYCLSKIGERDKAIEVLNQGLKKLKSDERTSSNLKALQNNAKMKMKGFGDIWYQFHLETPPMSMRMQAGARGAKGGKRMVRR